MGLSDQLVRWNDCGMRWYIIRLHVSCLTIPFYARLDKSLFDRVDSPHNVLSTEKLYGITYKLYVRCLPVRALQLKYLNILQLQHPRRYGIPLTSDIRGCWQKEVFRRCNWKQDARFLNPS